MKIECKLQREGGSVIELDGIEYHFEPQPDGKHVATVENEAHQDRLLSIAEGYRLYRPGKDAKDSEASLKETVVSLLGSSVHPATFDINGKTYALGDVVALAAEGFNPEDWNSMSDETRAELIDEQLDKLDADTNGDGDVDDSEEMQYLRVNYEAKFGKKPHPQMKAETLKAKLAE